MTDDREGRTLQKTPSWKWREVFPGAVASWPSVLLRQPTFARSIGLTPRKIEDTEGKINGLIT